MPESPSDQRRYEPQSADELMREFQGWSVSRGTNMRWYARRADSALVSGEDLLDLRDQIIGWLWRHGVAGNCEQCGSPNWRNIEGHLICGQCGALFRPGD